MLIYIHIFKSIIHVFLLFGLIRTFINSDSLKPQLVQINEVLL